MRNRTPERPLAATLATALALAGGGIAPAAWAAPDWSRCGAGFVVPERPVLERADESPGATYISSDDADLVQGGVSTLRGNVDLARDTRQLRADEVRYDEPGGTIDARGDVRVWDEGLYVTGGSGHVDLGAEQTTLDDAEYLLPEAHARGGARRITLEGKDLLRVHDASYTTCDPGDPDWVLAAREIRLDRVEEVGYARDVWVHFHDVPIFYSPFVTFPLSDKRKSGLLVPSFRVAGSTGVETTVPYYFNLAPNRDATLAARGMTRRGVQLQGEYRYLTTWGSGELGAEFMPHDRALDDDRVGLDFQHRGEFAPRWSTDVDVSWVSDRDYFEDLGTSLDIASRSFLERRGDLRYTGRGWTGFARVQDFQTLDNTVLAADRPYERLPQVHFSTTGRERNRQLNFGGFAEAVRFDRDSSVTGTRFDVRPEIAYPVRAAGWFVEPRAALRATQYHLDGTAPAVDDSPSRLLPTFSLDGGMFLDRSLSLGDRPYVQTLEPRLYYLFVPFDDQRDLPVFDTGEYTFSFAQLFRDDRFSGADRVGDANQVTLALTSRLLSPRSGAELARVSVGQIRHFRDRRVTLPGRARETLGGSDLVAEVAASVLEHWRVLGGIQWSPSEERTDRSTVGLRYQPDARRVVNLSYRFVRGTVEQTDVSMAWPVTPDLRAVGRWNYALADDRTLEAAAGFEYETCCWGVRSVFRRYLTNERGDYTNGVFLQLELKGLAGVGNASSFLERSIPGYRDEF